MNQRTSNVHHCESPFLMYVCLVCSNWQETVDRTKLSLSSDLRIWLMKISLFENSVLNGFLSEPENPQFLFENAKFFNKLSSLPYFLIIWVLDSWFLNNSSAGSL